MSLREFPLRPGSDVVQEVTAVHQLHGQADGGGALDDVEQPDDARVGHVPQVVGLVPQVFLQVRGEADPSLVDQLDGD